MKENKQEKMLNLVLQISGRNASIFKKKFTENIKSRCQVSRRWWISWNLLHKVNKYVIN